MQKINALSWLYPLQNLWRKWWRDQSPNKQDRFAFMAPLAAVVLFMAAITSAFWYLRYEELDREQEVIRRDVEYAQQRLRLRLIDKQAQITRIAQSIGNRETTVQGFQSDAQALLNQSPEIASLTWLDARGRLRAGDINIQEIQRHPETQTTFELSRSLMQAVYSQPITEKRGNNQLFSELQLHVPIIHHGKFEGVLLTEYALEGMLRYAVPSEISSKYAVSIRDSKNSVLAGQANKAGPKVTEVLPWLLQTNEYEVPITPIGYALSLHAQAYRTSQGLIGNGLFWLVAALSAMTAWMLIGTWRHTRRRVQAQQALIAETNFRRAMENSVLTGMRAMDMRGRITYVNAAFCQMTGWNEEELVGQLPPFPYWPEEDLDLSLIHI
jgi:PAS domain-containing protein